MDMFKKRFLSKLDRKKRQQAGLPGEDDAPLPDPVAPIHKGTHPRRNEHCPCGSGRKFKKCCGAGK